MVGPDRVAVVDWQTVTIGPPLADLAYFIGGALGPKDWSEHSAALCERYRNQLGGHGVGLSADELDAGVRRYALDGLVMAIGASQVVGQTDRGDDMFIAMAERSANHAIEAGTFDLF
jgi:aminoglycoside phosphotransferase (APT) family kinase protein